MGAHQRPSETDQHAASPASGGPTGLEAIVHALRQASILSPDEAIQLEPLPKNPQRNDAPTHHAFQVTRAGRPWCHLSIGPDTDERWHRAQFFAAACPSIACPPLFRLRVDARTLTGIAWFDGINLEDRMLEGSLDVSRARRVVERLLAALAATRASSSADAAAREFDSFCSQVLAAPAFAEVDRLLLREVILPFVRSHALRGAMETRVTNGDFIARNVLVADDGAVRLIDCELSHRTHFFAADLWRWREFSNLPAELRDLPGDTWAAPVEPWVEVYSILQHIVLAGELQGTAVAVAEARVRLPQLFAVISAASPALRASLLWPLLTAAAPAQPAGPANGWVNAQLFWSATGDFNEAESRRLAYPGGPTTRLAFLVPHVAGTVQLRLDPAEAPGLIRIAALHIDRIIDGRRQPILRSDRDWRRVRILRGLIELDATGELVMLSLDLDPSILLPALTLPGAPSDVIVELDIRYDSDLSALPGLLPR